MSLCVQSRSGTLLSPSAPAVRPTRMRVTLAQRKGPSYPHMFRPYSQQPSESSTPILGFEPLFIFFHSPTWTRYPLLVPPTQASESAINVGRPAADLGIGSKWLCGTRYGLLFVSARVSTNKDLTRSTNAESTSIWRGAVAHEESTMPTQSIVVTCALDGQSGSHVGSADRDTQHGYPEHIARTDGVWPSSTRLPSLEHAPSAIARRPRRASDTSAASALGPSLPRPSCSASTSACERPG